MKHQPHKGLFDEQEVLAKLNKLNDLLPRLSPAQYGRFTWPETP